MSSTYTSLENPIAVKKKDGRQKQQTRPHNARLWPIVCVLLYTCVLTRTYCPNMNARESLHFLRGVNFSNMGEMCEGIFCEGGWAGQSEVILR